MFVILVQLFGDTMNTASRMESTGVAGKIQVSEETARQLSDAGKGDWLHPREVRVAVKGKGSMQTFFVKKGDRSAASEHSDDRDHLFTEEDIQRVRDSKTERLIQWNVDVLLRLLEKIHARRPYSSPDSVVADEFAVVPILPEVSEIIALPKYDGSVAENNPDPLDKAVQEQVSKHLSLTEILEF